MSVIRCPIEYSVRRFHRAQKILLDKSRPPEKRSSYAYIYYTIFGASVFIFAEQGASRGVHHWQHFEWER